MRIVLSVAYALMGAISLERAFRSEAPWTYLFALMGALLLALAYATWTRSRFGLNPSPVNCPRCGTQQEKWQRPASVRQALFGGHRCAQCGCQMDQWGAEITASPGKS